MSDMLIRFLIGGFVVSLFAMIGDVLRPKSFAGLFGAAPSVALATLGLTVVRQGKGFAALEARAMIVGAMAFLVYAASVSWFLRRYRSGTLVTTIGLIPIWFVVAFSLMFLCKGVLS